MHIIEKIREHFIPTRWVLNEEEDDADGGPPIKVAMCFCFTILEEMRKCAFYPAS